MFWQYAHVAVMAFCLSFSSCKKEQTLFITYLPGGGEDDIVSKGNNEFLKRISDSSISYTLPRWLLSPIQVVRLLGHKIAFEIWLNATQI